MADKTNDEEALPQHESGGGRRRASGPKITGRSFADTTMASDEREQTADHRGESQGHRLDDGGARPDENRQRPADES